jgi:hypothetical protein
MSLSVTKYHRKWIDFRYRSSMMGGHEPRLLCERNGSQNCDLDHQLTYVAERFVD